MNGQLSNEDAIRERHRQRVEEMRREKERQAVLRRKLRKYAPPGAIGVLILIIAGTVFFQKKPADRQNDQNAAGKEVMVDSAKNGSMGENTTGKSMADGTESEKGNREANGSGKESDAPEKEADGNRNFTPMSRKIQILKGVPGTGEELGLAAQSVYEAARHRTYAAEPGENVWQIGDSLASGDPFYSENAILIDLGSSEIIAWKDAGTRINPASMTKILTVLVAAEHVEDLDDTFTITLDITDYSYVNDCSIAGFARDEVVTVRDLFYGTVLPSGADAALGLATYVAGSQEAFVELMNQKLLELGLGETAHFTNCVGIYDENHYCTVYDMAMILAAAIDDPLCREVLSAHTYETSKTEQHPEGIIISNWFLRRIEDHISGGEVLYAKTGYVAQSLSCAASYALSDGGKGYLCVTVGANSTWRCIYDHAGLYQQFFGGNDGSV